MEKLTLLWKEFESSRVGKILEGAFWLALPSILDYVLESMGSSSLSWSALGVFSATTFLAYLRRQLVSNVVG